ncbi:MAG: hypothetical protein ACF8OB_12140 [Phycisphaeraceae bacterium JB051]
MTTDTAQILPQPQLKSMNIPGAIVGLASVICTFTFMIVLMLCIFAREHVMVAAYIAAALGLMGVCLGSMLVKISSHQHSRS